MGLIKWLSDLDNKRNLKKLQKTVNIINGLESKYSSLSDSELAGQTPILKERLKNGETLDQILPDAYALVREASKRILHTRHFDVQLMGGIVLHQGRIAEMKTGEGKTLTSTLPVYLNALSGKPVHIVTVNEYLAKRDAEWMGKVHRFLGLTVGVVYSSQTPNQKKEAYNCDVTYGTNSEFGFDYLRDNMALEKSKMVTRGHEYVLIDEIDSILIDEARTPLILSGHSDKATDEYAIADKFAKLLKPDDYSIDEKQRTIHLTELGILKAEKYYNIENLSDAENLEINHNINNALQARFIKKKDNDYIVANDEIVIVDEFTGRMMVGRRYSDGLHQAIEAKEGLKVRSENKTLATITLQNFFKLYNKLSGMTGTAKTEEGEFKEIYGMDVVVIPSNKKVIREDDNDEFYFSHEAKMNAIVADIADCYERKQPVLVGTITVEKSEELSKILRGKKIMHNVLNAKNHMREADIIAQAGKIGAVTIATNMAGRGTDIKLGGNSEFLAKEHMKKDGLSDEVIERASSYAYTEDPEILKAKEKYIQYLEDYEKEVSLEKEKVVELGGLHIIGTERHESRRIDNQLRGRSGRQGDPGSSIFYISADDDLSRVFGSDRLKKMAELFKLDSDASIKMGFFSRGVEAAQKKVESNNYSIRKQVVEFDNVLNKQRAEVYEERNKIINKENVHDKIMDMIAESVEHVAMQFLNYDKVDNCDIEGFNLELEKRMLEPGSDYVTKEYLELHSQEEIIDDLVEKTIERFKEKIKTLQENGIKFDDFERIILIQTLDKKWMEHINQMDILRQGIGLRAYGNQNPVVVYQREGFDMFEEMIESMRQEVANLLLGVKININGTTSIMQKRPTPVSGGEHRAQGTIKYQKAEIGRNAPCPCGSGKKYKNCCASKNKL